MTLKQEAFNFIDTQKSAVLGTLMDGHPYGSVVPFVRYENKIIIYISTLAQHYKNIASNSKASFTLYDSSKENPQSEKRICLMGEAKISQADFEYQDLYFEQFPNSKNFSQTHGFYFCEIAISKAHFIQGFGKINWLELN